MPAGFIHKLHTARAPLFFPTAMTIGICCLGVVFIAEQELEHVADVELSLYFSRRSCEIESAHTCEELSIVLLILAISEAGGNARWLLSRCPRCIAEGSARRTSDPRAARGPGGPRIGCVNRKPQSAHSLHCACAPSRIVPGMYGGPVREP